MQEKTCGKMARGEKFIQIRTMPCGPLPCFCHQTTCGEPSLECFFSQLARDIVETAKLLFRQSIDKAGLSCFLQEGNLCIYNNHLPVHFDTEVHYRERLNVGLCLCWSFVCLCVTLRQAPSLGVSDSAATCHGSSAPGHSKCLNCEGTAIPQGKPKCPRSAPLPNHAVGPAHFLLSFSAHFYVEEVQEFHYKQHYYNHIMPA